MASIRPHGTRAHSIPEAKFCVISRGVEGGRPTGAARCIFSRDSHVSGTKPLVAGLPDLGRFCTPSQWDVSRRGGEGHIKPPPISNGGPCTPPPPPLPHLSFGRFLIFVSCRRRRRVSLWFAIGNDTRQKGAIHHRVNDSFPSPPQPALPSNKSHNPPPPHDEMPYVAVPDVPHMHPIYPTYRAPRAGALSPRRRRPLQGPDLPLPPYVRWPRRTRPAPRHANNDTERCAHVALGFDI